MPQAGQKSTSAGSGGYAGGTAVFSTSPPPNYHPVASTVTTKGRSRKEKVPVYCARCGRPVELVGEEITRFSVTRGFPVKKTKTYKCPKRNKLRNLLNRILITQKLHSKFELDYSLMADKANYNPPEWNDGNWVMVGSTHYVDDE